MDFERIYEPAEDSYLLLDTLSSDSEKAFLQSRFNTRSPKISSSPLVLEIGTGSGVVLSFVHAHAALIFGRADILTAGVDVNRYACKSTEETVRVAEKEQTQERGQGQASYGCYIGNILGDLTTPLRIGTVDMLIFNPPYVPTPTLPSTPGTTDEVIKPSFESDSHLLELSYAGGKDGMETTNRLLDSLPDILSQERGCAYILFCAQNKPEDVKQRIRRWGAGWKIETVGTSGKKGGWEKLQIIRIWRIPIATDFL